MKHRKLLLLAFLLTLFVTQQARGAGGNNLVSGRNPSQINPIPANDGVLTQSVEVYIYELIPSIRKNTKTTTHM